MNLLHDYQTLLTSISAAQQEIDEEQQALFSKADVEGLVRSAAQAVQGVISSKVSAGSQPADLPVEEKKAAGDWGLVVPGMESPFPLVGAITIGRSENCDLQLDDRKASRQHARLERRQDGFWIVDLGSSNGVFVNGKRITDAVRLDPGDQIRIGDTTLEVAGPAP
jgi:hypothetical protein